MLYTRIPSRPDLPQNQPHRAENKNSSRLRDLIRRQMKWRSEGSGERATVEFLPRLSPTRPVGEGRRRGSFQRLPRLWLRGPRLGEGGLPTPGDAGAGRQPLSLRAALFAALLHDEALLSSRRGRKKKKKKVILISCFPIPRAKPGSGWFKSARLRLSLCEERSAVPHCAAPLRAHPARGACADPSWSTPSLSLGDRGGVKDPPRQEILSSHPPPALPPACEKMSGG